MSEKIIDNNKPIDVMIGNESVLMSVDEYQYLQTLGIQFGDGWEQSLLDDKQYTLLAKALFTLSRVDDAWDVIENHKEDINYEELVNITNGCPYFQIKRDAQNVYKYMYDNNIIDDKSYAYFQILGGSLNDMDFWKEYLSNKTVSEKLEELNMCYNGTNPFEVGLIVPSKETIDFLLDGIEPKEMLDDFILGSKPAVFFDTETLINLMADGNLQSVNFPRYFSIILEMYLKELENTTDEDAIRLCKDLINSMWLLAYDLCEDKISEINLDTVSRLDSFIESDLLTDALTIQAKNLNDDNDISKLVDDARNNDLRSLIVKMIINSLAFMNYPYRYKNMLHDIRFQIDNIRVGDYLKPENYPYVLSYKLLSFLNTDDFIIKYPFPAVYNCIYYKGIVFLNGKIVKYEDADSELEFVHEYYSTGKINESINEKCSSEEEYLEVMYAITDFRYRMTEQYNKDLIKMKNNQ